MDSTEIGTPERVGRAVEWTRLVEFASSGVPRPTLGIVWGRRRVGKSFLLHALARELGGLHHEAVRGTRAEALRELGARIAEFRELSTPLALGDWEAAIGALLELGRDRETVVVLDEFPYLVEHSPELPSVIQRALGPGGTPSSAGGGTLRTRLLLCGSATTVMGELLGGTAPLRGRAGLDLRVSPFDFREARRLHGIAHLPTALRVHAVIGGVAAYAREMTEHDLPRGPRDFERWILRRVLSPAAPLFHEVPLLLSEDPVTSRARKPNLYHGVLAGVASGHHAHARLTRHVGIPGTSLAPIVEALVQAEVLARIEDPLRENRPTYLPADPMIRFHYAILRRHQGRLARSGPAAPGLWASLEPTFSSAVLGPVFESMAREWVRVFADPALLGGIPDHVGPSTLTLGRGVERQLDVVVAADDGRTPSDRTVLALGEAKLGERIGAHHLARLEEARAHLGGRAEGARLLLFGSRFEPGLRRRARERGDLVLVNLRTLYGVVPGSDPRTIVG